MPQARQGEVRQGPALTSAFGLSLLLKGADAVLEAIGGVLMLVVSLAGISRFVVALRSTSSQKIPVISSPFIGGKRRPTSAVPVASPPPICCPMAWARSFSSLRSFVAGSGPIRR